MGISSSALSYINSKIVRRLGQQALGLIPNVKATKLINTIEALAESNEILAHENTYLCIQFDKQKKKTPKEYEFGAAIAIRRRDQSFDFSPTKIARAKEIVAEKEEKKIQKKKELKDRKVEIALGKQRKEFEREQKELNRKLFTVLKEKDCLEKKFGRNDTALLQQTNNLSERMLIRKEKQEITCSNSEVEEILPVISLRSPRLRRKMWLPKRYDNCDMYID